MLNIKINITKEFIDFINICFGKDFLEALEYQHEGYNKGKYPYYEFEKAFELFKDHEFEFEYNCSDCSFPKFRDLKNNEIQACISCGD